MPATAMPSPRFLRKTELGPNEYRKRFRQIDDEIIAAITSPEADAVTPLMSKIYLRLTTAPDRCWERQGVLRFEAEAREEKRLTAWAVLCDWLNVSSATANKALAWMHKEGIIGYFAGKNGVGVRVFLNRASSSIGVKPASGGKKILDFSRASNGEARASRNEAAFNDTFGDLEISDPDNSGAPASGAENRPANKTSTGREPQRSLANQGATEASPAEVTAQAESFGSIDEIVRRLRVELEPTLRMAAAQAATREHERTRQWLEERGLPKAARVAQREAFNVLRQHGLIKNSARAARAELAVGQHKVIACEPKVLNADEVREVAEICVSLLECHGQAIDVTLAEISAETGGYLLAEDAPKVRERAVVLARQRSQKE